MSDIVSMLLKLASDIDDLGAIEYADQVDDISSIMTGTNVASGQHTPAGDAQWSVPSVGVNMSKDAMGLTDVPIGDAPYANREGIPEDDIDTQFLSGDEVGVNLPPENDMSFALDEYLEDLEASLFSINLKKEAHRVFSLRSVAAIDERERKILLFITKKRRALLVAIAKLKSGMNDAYGFTDKDDKLKSFNQELDAFLFSKALEMKEVDIVNGIEALFEENKLGSGGDQYYAARYRNKVKPLINPVAKALVAYTSAAQRRPAESSPAESKPLASGPVAPQSAGNPLAELQNLLGVESDGVWGPQTAAAWELFVDSRWDGFVKKVSLPDEATKELAKTNWKRFSDALGLGWEASYSGMIEFYEVLASSERSYASGEVKTDPASTESTVEATPKELSSTPSVRQDEVVKALQVLLSEKIPHEAENESGTAQSLGGGYSKRRTNRYLRHLDKLIDGDGDAATKVAAYLVENYSEELTKTLADSKKFHDEQVAKNNTSVKAYNEEHRFAHMISKVYELLQKTWGDISREKGMKGRDRRSTRRQRRQDERGNRRLNRR